MCGYQQRMIHLEGINWIEYSKGGVDSNYDEDKEINQITANVVEEGIKYYNSALEHAMKKVNDAKEVAARLFKEEMTEQAQDLSKTDKLVQGTPKGAANPSIWSIDFELTSTVG